MPVRAKKLSAALSHFGVVVTAPKAGGSHWIARRLGTVYPIPCHNGPKTELSDVYIRGVCRAFGIDEQELRKRF